MTKNLRKVCFSFSAVFVKKTQAETQTETEKFHIADLNFWTCETSNFLMIVVIQGRVLLV